MFFTSSSVEKILLEGKSDRQIEVRINADTADEEDKEVFGHRKRHARQRATSNASIDSYDASGRKMPICKAMMRLSPMWL